MDPKMSVIMRFQCTILIYLHSSFTRFTYPNTIHVWSWHLLNPIIPDCRYFYSIISGFTFKCVDWRLSLYEPMKTQLDFIQINYSIPVQVVAAVVWRTTLATFFFSWLLVLIVILFTLDAHNPGVLASRWLVFLVVVLQLYATTPNSLVTDPFYI